MASRVLEAPISERHIAAPDGSTSAPAERARGVLAVVFGSVMALMVSGYQFGRGNQTCYLLDGMRTLEPTLLRHDWFMTQTLQYHAVFSRFTEALMAMHILEPGLLVGYVILIVLWQLGWYRLARGLGASDRAYVLSVVFYFISSAGVSLGVYQFMQDGCFLPSNVANVAMLWGFYFWIMARPGWAGACLGLAGIVHVNYAVAGIMIWPLLVAWQCWDARRGGKAALGPLRERGVLTGSALALGLCAVNVLYGAISVLRQPPGLTLSEFVAVYVRFRHTHHFDPLHWNNAIWIGFLWPIPLAIWAIMRAKARGGGEELARRRGEASRIFLIISAMLAFAFVFAGVWYVSETLVQLCLFRFSIYVKLLSCLGAGYLVCDSGLLRRGQIVGLLAIIPVGLLVLCAMLVNEGHSAGVATLSPVMRTAVEHVRALGIIAVLSAMPVAYGLRRRAAAGWVMPLLAAAGLVLVAAVAPAVGALGLGMTPEPDDADYRQVCAWAEANTPLDAVFVVPPAETDFRLYGKRAIVINFKHIPQLGHEIREWRDRLADVLGTSDFAKFPRDYPRTLAALAWTYEARPAQELFAVANKYDAEYVVVAHDLGPSYASQIAYHPQGNRYFVYQVPR